MLICRERLYSYDGIRKTTIENFTNKRLNFAWAVGFLWHTVEIFLENWLHNLILSLFFSIITPVHSLLQKFQHHSIAFSSHDSGNMRTLSYELFFLQIYNFFKRPGTCEPCTYIIIYNFLQKWKLHVEHCFCILLTCRLHEVFNELNRGIA